MEDIFRVFDIHNMIADGVVETCTNDDNKIYYRREMENQHSVENFFINYLWGLPGWKSKVIGNTVLFWEV